MQTVTLMVLPPPEEGKPPQFLIRERGMWYYVEGSTQGDIKAVQQDVQGELVRGMNHPPSFDLVTLETVGSELLYQALVPWQVQERLRRAVDQSTPDDPALLCIHCHSEVDWIPWELMYDNLAPGFLGLLFQVARLPMVSLPRRLVDSSDGVGSEPHKVARVHNVLGEGILDQPGDRTAWENTFAGLARPPRVEPCPPDLTGASPTIAGLKEMVEPDIIHITCHAEVQDAKVGPRTAWHFSDTQLVHPGHFGTALNRQFAAQHPLVFGNACSSAGFIAADPSNQWGIVPTFGLRCAVMGAAGFVGTFARVGEGEAVQFASQFYRELLDNQRPIARALYEAKTKRKQAYDGAATHDPSWLFYCLYGPPETQFEV